MGAQARAKGNIVWRGEYPRTVEGRHSFGLDNGSTSVGPIPVRGSGAGNRLLDRLPKEEYERLVPLLEPTPLAAEQALYNVKASRVPLVRVMRH
jgi:hypothetical protein